MHTYLLAAVLGMLLAGCGAAGMAAPTPSLIPTVPVTNLRPEPSSTPLVVPTQQPTALMEATASATPGAVASTLVPIVNTPAPAGLLPAPLLYIDDNGQIALLDVDGTPSRVLTHETLRIIDFDVFGDGSLVYLTYGGQDGSGALVRSAADGSGRVELAHGVMRGLAIHPNGSSFAIGVLGATTRSSGAELAIGAWSFSAAGGEPTEPTEPTMLQAASEPGENGSGTHYTPLQWSGDGTGLLLRTTLNNGPAGPAGDISSTGIALYEPASGSTRDILPIGGGPICYDPILGESSDVLYCASAQYLGPDTPALWSMATSGDSAIRELVPAEDGDQVTIVSGPAVIGGWLYMLVGTAPSGAVELPASAAQRTGLHGMSDRQQLSDAMIEIGYDGGLWAPDGNGIVAGRPAAGGIRTLVWYPFGGEPVELVSGSIGTLHWARSIARTR